MGNEAGKWVVARKRYWGDLESWDWVVYLVGKVGKIMGKRSVSLPSWLLEELDISAATWKRSFSAEVLLRLERDRDANPTGVAKITSDPTKEISGGDYFKKPLKWVDDSNAREVSVHASLKRGDVAGIAKKIDDGKPGLELPAEMLNHPLCAKTTVSKLAEKIASKIPGVKKAIDLDSNPVGDWPVKGMVSKSAKSRPEDSGGRVELVKGFWRDTYDSVGDAIIEAQQRGWKEGEYTIKPLDK